MFLHGRRLQKRDRNDQALQTLTGRFNLQQRSMREKDCLLATQNKSIESTFSPGTETGGLVFNMICKYVSNIN